MTEVPEHLLRRSRERRAALGLGGGDDAPSGEAPAAPAPAPPAPTAAVEVAEPAESGGAVAVVESAPEPAIAPTPIGTRVPIWVMPVLLALPIWAFVYLGAFGNRTTAAANNPVALGNIVFTANCASCHGANGEGGVGPQLAGGEVLKVWPSVSDHIKWVHTGGAPFVGGTIGSAIKIPVPANNVMPGFAGTLSDTQIQQVVCFERVSFGGEAQSATNCPGSPAS